MKWMLSVAIAASLAAGPAVSATPAHTGIPAYVSKAVADPARGDDVKNDARRKVAELQLRMLGVSPARAKKAAWRKLPPIELSIPVAG